VNQPVIWGAPHAERTDAARNRLHLLTTARQMLAEQGPARPTTDGLAERVGLAKGTVFRRLGATAAKTTRTPLPAAPADITGNNPQTGRPLTEGAPNGDYLPLRRRVWPSNLGAQNSRL
jgi:polyketide synthase 12